VLTAILLVTATREGLATLGPRLAETDGVTEVYTVTGEWDFVAIVRVREQEDLARIVTHDLTRRAQAIGRSDCSWSSGAR
jgi:DNA-binding Lrp family transcriptional regulator